MTRLFENFLSAFGLLLLFEFTRHFRTHDLRSLLDSHRYFSARNRQPIGCGAMNAENSTRPTLMAMNTITFAGEAQPLLPRCCCNCFSGRFLSLSLRSEGFWSFFSIEFAHRLHEMNESKSISFFFFSPHFFSFQYQFTVSAKLRRNIEMIELQRRARYWRYVRQKKESF